jgi:hypothetical protein
VHCGREEGVRSELWNDRKVETGSKTPKEFYFSGILACSAMQLFAKRTSTWQRSGKTAQALQI